MTSTEQEQEARVDRREEVAEALIVWWAEKGGVDVDEIRAVNNGAAAEYADALLPLIARFEREAAAKALTDAADDWSDRSKSPDYDSDEIADFLQDRAAALTDVDGVQS